MKKIFFPLLLATTFSYAVTQLQFGNPGEVFTLIKNNNWIPNNPVIIDAGAYTGEESKAMATQFWPEGHVYAFEPVPDIYTRLVNTTKNVRNITTSTFALSDKSGTAKFYVSEEPHAPNVSSMSSSLLEPKEHLKYSSTIFPKTTTVQTITLDEWSAQSGVDHVDFLWLDLQGSELSVLKGSPKIMKTVKVIFTEVEFVEAYKGQSLYHELREWLESQGFTMVAKNFTDPLSNAGWGGVYWFGDCLFVRK